MRRLASATFLTITLSAGSVEALESFTLPYGGSAVVPVDCLVQPQACGLVTFPWKAVVVVQTVSSADGVYSFESFPPANPANTLTSLSLVSDTSGSGLLGNFDLSTEDSGLLGGLTATLQGGRMTSLDGVIVGDFHATWTFAGTAVSFDLCCLPRTGPFSGQAALVPEPATYALMIAGLAATAWMRRRRAGRQRLAPAGPVPAI